MRILASLLFILLFAECISRFFFVSRIKPNAISLIVFLALAPPVLGLEVNKLSSDDLLNPELSTQCLLALSPLIVAALVFVGLQAVVSMSVSKEVASIINLMRPIWLVGFVIIVLRNLAPIALTVLVTGPKA